MDWSTVTVVIDALEARGVRLWLAGGWGVDVLVGRQTREHRDLDLMIDADDLDSCLATLSGLAYVVETDWLPLRIELARDGGDRVDVHPVAYDADGRGIQGDPGGTHYRYEPGDRTSGTIGERIVACASADLQRRAHAGYEPRPRDLHDLILLDGLG